MLDETPVSEVISSVPNTEGRGIVSLREGRFKLLVYWQPRLAIFTALELKALNEAIRNVVTMFDGKMRREYFIVLKIKREELGSRPAPEICGVRTPDDVVRVHRGFEHGVRCY